MKKVILLALVAFAATACQPCEQKCKFNAGDEIEIKAKKAINNNGVIKDVDHNMDCSCSYTVSRTNMLNFEYEDIYEEHELEAK